MAKKAGPQPVGELQDDGSWEKTSWIPEVAAEHRVRVERVSRDLDLEGRAASDGYDNLPHRDDKTMNATQMEVCNRVFAGILMLNQFLAEQVTGAAEQARRLIGREVDPDSVSDRIQTQVDHVFAERRSELLRLRVADLGEQRGLRYFRHVNGLNREAHYKEAQMQVVGILAAVLVLESLLNGALLAGVMANGLVGGASLALMISAINVGLGVAAGLYGWRYAGHRSKVWRNLGIAITVICHGAALAWNLFVAHFREVAETAAASEAFNFDMAALGAQTLAHIGDHGVLGLGSIQAWALFLFGVFIHFVAAKEGWDDIADRYPDYKKYDLRAREARAAYDEALADLRASARQAVEGLENEAIATANKAINNSHAVSALLDLATQRRQEVKDSEDEWVAGGTLLLTTYRNINRKVRDEESAPAYFEHFPTADDYRRRAFGPGQKPSDEVEAQARTISAAIEELRRLREKAEARAEAAAETIKAVHKLITQAVKRLDKRLDAEHRGATEAAEEELLAQRAADGNPVLRVIDSQAVGHAVA